MLPTVNQTMYLLTEGGQETITLRSRVADENEHSLYIEVPLNEQSHGLYRAQMGERFQCFYFTKEGVKHVFAGSVTGFRKETVSLVEIRKPDLDKVSKEQRRNFLRVEANLEIAVKCGAKLRFVAVTEDVGGGGVSFLCDKKWPIEQNVVLSCWLLLSYRSGTVAHAKFEGEVVRVLSVSEKKHLVMMRFEEISDSDQQKIIRYCFERQLDMRRE